MTTNTYRIIVATLIMLTGCRPEMPAQPLPTGPSTAAVTALPLAFELTRTYPLELQTPVAFALAPDGNAVVGGQDAVVVIDLGTGNRMRSWTVPAPVTAMATDNVGNVYVCSTISVHVYSSTGTLQNTWGTKGTGPGQLQTVTGIAVTDSEVFLADSGRRQIHRFGHDGDFMGAFGARDPDTENPGLIVPSPILDCSITPDGLLVLANPGCRRIELHDMNGQRVRVWGKAGTGLLEFSGCCNPANLATARVADGTTRIAAAEKGLPRIQVFDDTGNLLAYIGPEHFNPRVPRIDLAMTTEGRIYALDPVAAKLLRFSPMRKESGDAE